MSRLRSNVKAAAYQVSWWYGQTADSLNSYWTGASATQYASDKVATDKRESSIILDQIAPTQYWLDRFKGADHTRVVSGSYPVFEYIFSPPTPPLYTKLVCDFAPQVPSIPTPNWDPLIDDLAGQLEQGSENSFQAIVFIAEARKTWEMIKNPLSFLKPTYRKKLRGRTANGLDTLSSIWLSGRYGWKPFLSDVENFSVLSAKLLNSSMLPKLQSRFSGRSRTISTTDIVYTSNCSKAQWDTFKNSITWSNSRCLFYRLRNYTVEQKLCVGCYALDPMTNITSMLHRLVTAAGATVTWRNIRDVIWEVLPFSFVIDWFIDFSNAWRPLNEATILQKTASRLGYSYKTIVTCQPEFILGKPWPVVYEPNSVWYNKPVTRSRVLLSAGNGYSTRYHREAGLPYSSSEIFKTNGLTLIHGIDGISLTLQKILNAKTHH